MELKRYATLLWRWSWLLVLGALLAGGGAYAAGSLAVPIYAASTTLLINQAPSSRPTLDYNTLITSERLAKTYAELLRKRPVLDAVISRLGLTITPADLADRMKVSVVRDTQLIVLVVEDPSPQRAADIANETVKAFSQQNRDLQAGRYADSMQSLRTELDKIQADMDATQAQIAALGSQQTDDKRRLQDQLAQYRQGYTTLLNSYEEVRLSEVQTSDSVSVAETAQSSAVPVRPRVLLNTLLAAIVGALVALGIALLREYLDDSVKSSDAVNTLIGAPTLATIGRLKAAEGPEKLVTIVNRHSSVAEAYRILRVNMELSSVDAQPRTLLVTSGGPAEGKSTTVANLAVTLAQSGKRVILVDADLRRPTLHKLFKQANNRGFTTALLRQETSSLEDHMVSTIVNGLMLLPSGPLPPDPAALLGSQRMASLLVKLKERADVVLFDSPPLLSVADAAVLARSCDAALLVVRASSTRGVQLKRAFAQLAQTGVAMLGVVLNRVSGSADGYDEQNYYYYGETKRDKSSALSPLISPVIGKNGNSAEHALEVVELRNGRDSNT